MTDFEAHRAFSPVTVLTSKPGQLRGIGTAYVAARFILEEWPITEGSKLATARLVLLTCLEGGCAAAVARVAFVEAAREANIYVPPPEMDPLTLKDSEARQLGLLPD
ncbi:hypothetical protein J2X72_005048 [Phyllobacterium sp. 1468]|uniref:DUF982 domain-containing protein n=1 Tax=Phyllobacterium sp. 1468 TaxID=2817759 RepID=UPI0028671BA6|nr:DUF982 domain-containing protein [Phyllobacterium sp. 1468]MDR6636234.1 hypothetical protein [Phyllobacterium sp. 1468]